MTYSCISETEYHLANKINDFRQLNGLENLQVSVSLCLVAKTHIWDLETNHPDTEECTAASWSDQGKWNACCFSKKEADYECMWAKPKEIADFPYKGYELSYYQDNQIDIDEVAMILETTDACSNMILSKANYSNKKWKSFGIAIGEHNVSIWFTQAMDAKGSPDLCSNDAAKDSLSISNTDSLEFETSFVPSDRVQIEISQPERAQNTSGINTEGRFHIIVASFVTLDAAQEAQKKLAKDNNNIEIIANDNKYRLSIERCSTMQEANQRKKQLSEQFKGCWVLEN